MGRLLRRAYLEVIGYARAIRTFRRACATAFNFLVTEFGFAPPTFQETSYGAICRYESPTTIVEIHLDWSEELIFPYVRPAAGLDAEPRIPPPGVLLDAVMVHHGERPGSKSRSSKRSECMRSCSNTREHSASMLRMYSAATLPSCLRFARSGQRQGGAG